MMTVKADSNQAIKFLDGGDAFWLGGGVFVLMQAEERQYPQSVVITAEDMKGIMTGKLEFMDGGEVDATGCGTFVLYQADEYGTVQSVVVSEDDMVRLIDADQFPPIRSRRRR